jgi:type II secretory pathway component PulF
MTDPSSAANSALPLDVQTAEVVIERAAMLAITGMPLSQGLRAAAQESDSSRIATGLRKLADELDRGRTLEDCAASAKNLPPYVVGLIRAAQRTGDIGLTLASWSENRRSAHQYWRAAIAALVYPALSVGLAIGVFLLFATLIIPTFRKMFEEFGLKLPAATTYLMHTTDFMMKFLPIFLIATLVLAIAARVVGGRVGWSWLVSNMPLLGPVWHWSGVAEMLRGLGLLVQYRIPLPEALRLTANGITDAYVAEQCKNLASRLEGGTSLTMSLVRLRTLPLSIVPLVRWGEQHDTLDDALRSAAELVEGRLRSRTHVLAQIVPPLVFVIVGVTLASAVIALFLPLISLIQGLS